MIQTKAIKKVFIVHFLCKVIIDEKLHMFHPCQMSRLGQK